MSKNVRFYLFLIYWLILYTLTSLPGYSLPKSIKISDKVEHLLAYALFGVLFNLYFWEKLTVSSRKYFNLTLIIGGLYALFDEVHQLFIPMRSGEIFDWVADFLGLLISVWIIKIVLKYKPQFLKKG